MAETSADFESVADRYYADVYRFALSLARHPSDAEDLTQETFLRYARKWWQVRDPARIKAWLITTVFREFNGQRRHAQRYSHQDLEEIGETLAAMPVEAAVGLDGETVMRALNDVDEMFRAPLALYYLEDFSYREIAGILGIPVGTVMSRLARGKARLKVLLATGEEGAAAVSRVPLPGSDGTG